MWMEQLEEDVRRPRQESTTTCEGKDTQDDRSASYAIRDEDSAVTSSARNEDVQMGMRPHAKRPCEKRKHQGENGGRECRRQVQESTTEVVWPRKEARPRLRRKKDSGDGTTMQKKARKTETEMDGLCQPREPSERRKRKSMTELAGGELCLPQRPDNLVGAARRRRTLRAKHNPYESQLKDFSPV